MKSKESLRDIAVKLAGSDELVDKMLAETNEIIREFEKDQSELVKKYILKIKDKTKTLSSSVDDKENREKLSSLISLDTADYLIDSILAAAATSAAVIKVKLPNFIFKAADHFEKAMINEAMRTAQSTMIDMIMKMKPEPKKESLS